MPVVLSSSIQPVQGPPPHLSKTWTQKVFKPTPALLLLLPLTHPFPALLLLLVEASKW
jgi:hypothetical protein